MNEDQERCTNTDVGDYLSKPSLKQALTANPDYQNQVILLPKSNNSANDFDRVLEQQVVGKFTRSSTNQLAEAHTLSIDWEHLHQICDGNEEFEVELLHTFVDDTQIHLEAAEEALGSNDLSKLEQEAHHIKGASANLGITTMQEAASRLERQAAQGQMHSASDLLKNLRASLNGVQSLLTEARF